MDYKILTQTSVERMTTLVQEHLNDGWQLHGTLTVFNHQLAQTVTKQPKRARKKRTTTDD